MKSIWGDCWRIAVALTIAVTLAGCAPDSSRTDQLTDGSFVTGDASPTPPASSVDPAAVVTIAGVDVDGQNVTVAGLITQVEDSGGECTFVLSSTVSGQSESITRDGIPNIGSTSCSSAQFPVSELSKGPWTAQLKYRSTTLVLDSELVKLEIP